MVTTKRFRIGKIAAPLRVTAEDIAARRYTEHYAYASGKLIMKAIVLTFLLLPLAAASQVYPVQVTTRLTPPYSPYLEDYTTGEQSFAVHIQVRDLALDSYAARLRLTIEGPGITLKTDPRFVPPPLYLSSGPLQTFYGEDLRDYFHPENLLYSGLPGSDYTRLQRLPDGIYRFTVEVLDYNRGTVVSNPATATAWIILNDPPILMHPSNFSVLRVQDPLNIMFTWTPRNTGSPNAVLETDYTFRLIELWPMDRDPGDAFQSQAPLLETTTSLTQILYSVAETPLIPGQRYAWQVQARDRGGKDLFRNDGRSEIFVFTYGETMAVPANLRMRWAKPTTLAIKWDAIRHDAAGVRYRLQYRPRLRREDHKWYETWTRFTDKTLYNLEANTDYEMRIRAENALQESEYSGVEVFRTLREESGAFVCGDVSPPPAPANTLPVFPLSVNDTIHAGGYSVLVRDVMKVGSRYYGSGFAIVPWFNKAKVRVSFENISVNDRFWLTAGLIKSAWSAESRFMIEEQVALAPGNAPEAGAIDITVVAADSLIALESAVIAAVTKDEAGNIVVTTTDGRQQVLAHGKSYALTDAAGNGYVVDEQGNIAKTTAREASAAATRGKRTYAIALKFAKGDGLFGFDEKRFEALTPFYQRFPDGTFIPWKALSSAEADRIYAELQTTDFDRTRLRFEAGGVSVAASVDKDRIALTLQGRARFEDELLAFYPASDTLPPRVAGKLNLATYDPVRYDLRIVPVNGAALPGGLTAGQISEELNKVYRQAVVSWTVTVSPSLDVPLSGAFDDGNMGLLSNYTGDMKKVLAAHGPLHQDAYYLFVVSDPVNGSTLGYMPRNRQAGFVFAEPHHGDAAEFLKTLAHELGHGAFNLKHTFTEHNLPAGITDNLMDYSQGTALYKYQWDQIHEPRSVMGLFEGGEEGAMGISGVALFYEHAAPLLTEKPYQDWLKKIKDLYDFFKECDDAEWESFNGQGIIPYCFWRDQQISSYLHYTNADLPFTAGLIDGAYMEAHGLYQLPQAIRDISKFPGKVVYAYTRAYWECRTEKLVAGIAEYEYVVEQMARIDKEGGLWNWVRDQWHDYKGQRTDIEEFFQDCRDADDLREAVDDLFELVSDWKEIKELSAEVFESLQSYWDTLRTSDNHGRYQRGALIAPAASLLLPAGAGVASKAEKMKEVLRKIRALSREKSEIFLMNIREGFDNGMRRIGILDDEALQLLQKFIRMVPGPALPDDIARTFTNSIYTNRKLLHSETFFKYHGINNRTGKKYTWFVKRKYASEMEVREGLAIRHDWDVDIKFVSEFEVPAGTWVSEGTAAAQGIGYPGQHYQAVILNVVPEWIITTTQAF